MTDDARTERHPLDVEDGDGIGDLIPIMALSVPLVAVGIPFLGVAGSMGLGGVVLGTVAVVIVLLVGASAAKGVLRYRHSQRIEELRLRLELTRQETAKLAEVNRVVDESFLGP